MVSTLKLTKIQIPNSDSDVISLDASTGNITLNKNLGGTSITIQGENTNTTNLQQGLAKAHCVFDGSGTASITDSFNISSLSDDATGRHTSTLTSSMASSVTSVSISYNTDGSNNYNMSTASMTASTVQLRGIQWGDAFYDDPRGAFARFGGLA